jgi:hypothetical protein
MDGWEVEVWDPRWLALPPSFCEKFRPQLFGEHRDLLWANPEIILHIRIVAHLSVRITLKSV